MLEGPEAAQQSPETESFLEEALRVCGHGIYILGIDLG